MHPDCPSLLRRQPSHKHVHAASGHVAETGALGHVNVENQEKAVNGEIVL